MQPLFSIVIPVYNRQDTIDQLLDSIFSCKLPFPIEIIVINSGSTDKTVEIIKQYKDSRIRVVTIAKSEFNHGLTRNLGVQKSRGKFIFFFSGDARIISKNIFTRTVTTFEKNPNCVLSFVRQIPYESTPFIQQLEATVYFDDLDNFIDSNGQVKQSFKKPFTPFKGTNKMLWYFNSDVAACYRKDYLVQYPFPKTEHGGEDVFAAKQALELGYSKIYDSKLVVQHSHSYSFWEYIKREYVEVSLVINKLHIPKKNRLFSKLKKIVKSSTLSISQKAINMLELTALYSLKLIFILKNKSKHCKKKLIEEVVIYTNILSIIQRFRFKKVLSIGLVIFKYLFVWTILSFLLLEISLQLFAYTYVHVSPSQSKKIVKRPKIKILAVGESTTGGLWIENRSYPIQLKEKLNRHFNCENCVQINTLELPGASSSWSLAELPNYIEKYKPDIVLIMTGFNDPFFYTYNIELQAIQNLFEKGAHYPQLYKLILDLLRASKVLSLTKFIYIQTFVSAESLYDFAEVAYRNGKVTEYRIKFGEEYRKMIDSQTKMNLRDMVRISKYNGVTPILMTYHESGINNLIREVSIEENIHLIDIEANFFKECPRVECIFTRDNWHPNEKGYDYISNITMSFLISKDLLQE